MKIASTKHQTSVTLNGDAEDRDSQEAFRANAKGEDAILSPSDVARAISGADTGGVARPVPVSRQREVADYERNAVAASGILPQKAFPKPAEIDAQGTEHVVRFLGSHVEKFQKRDAWVPLITPVGLLGIGHAVPSEYLRRLQLQNDLFGDDIRVTALTRANRFVISQPTVRGGEPSENEIRDVLQNNGWKRVPVALQDLPIQLMGSVWWHDEEGLVMLDARKPNFKKTENGVLPIDLILADLSDEMRTMFGQ